MAENETPQPVQTCATCGFTAEPGHLNNRGDMCKGPQPAPCGSAKKHKPHFIMDRTRAHHRRGKKCPGIAAPIALNVREDLTNVCHEAYENGGHWAHPADNIADAILARFTVVPRAQVKPAEESTR